MNILPAAHVGNIAPNLYSVTALQNSLSVHLQKQKTPLRTASPATTKNDEERKHIRDLLSKLPDLTNLFHLHRKIGEGSFSSVFLASLKSEDHLPEYHRNLFAIKHLVPTSHPSRIEQELRCLKFIGGRENVVGLNFCMRQYDTVIFAMPYLPHTKFSEYVLKMDVMETKMYMKNLFLALRRVHQFNIIHRDVKPSNFLYDRENRRFLLVDFGLAQKIDTWPPKNDNGSEKPTGPIFDIHDDSSLLTPADPNQSIPIVCKKRKLSDLTTEQVSLDNLEPQAKKAFMENMPSENFPLKPLQGDHPKIQSSIYSPQTNRPVVLPPKLAAVKRQVFANDNENAIQATNNTRADNICQPSIPVQTLDVNNYSSQYVPTYNYPMMSNPYQAVNYPNICANSELQKLSQYYSYISALNYNSLIANGVYGDVNNYPKDILRNQNPYTMNTDYRANIASIQSSIDYRNSLYASQYKNLQNLGYPSGAQELMMHNLKTAPLKSISQPFQQDKKNGMVINNEDQGNCSNLKVNGVTTASTAPLKKPEALKSASRKSAKTCPCSGRAVVCTVCLERRAYNAPRAGTQGFRPPEVLLKYAEQTTAVDLWACGVILLSVVSGCYPFFRAPDDLTALAEMVTLFGSTRLKDVANVLGRHLMCSYNKRPLDLRKLCSHLRYRALKSNSTGNANLVKSTILKPYQFKLQNPAPTLTKADGLPTQETDVTDTKLQMENVMNKVSNKLETSNCNKSSAAALKRAQGQKGAANTKAKKTKTTCDDCTLPLNSCVCASETGKPITNGKTSNAGRMWCGFPDEAFDLLERLLDLNPHTRITASEALLHPFLADL